MKTQLQKTIAELVILKEFLKTDLDRILIELKKENGDYFKIANELTETNEKIMLIQDLLRKLMRD
jgi:hypothetical protein